MVRSGRRSDMPASNRLAPDLSRPRRPGRPPLLLPAAEPIREIRARGSRLRGRNV